MIKKLVLITIIIAVVVSVGLVLNWYTETSVEENEDEPLGDTTDEIVNEMADYLINKYEDIEIGEMI